eukprot:SAG31_NODE_4064_length_3624_cov_2.236312_3_plen_58_part_00
MVEVLLRQVSSTLNSDMNYDYKVSGGSPTHIVMCEKLKEITKKVNEVLGTDFNAILE